MTDSGSYSGAVTAGGPASTRILPALTITKVSVGPMDNNAYLLRCRGTDELLLVDAAADPGVLLDLVQAQGGSLRQVVTTHEHHDHWQALDQVVHATGTRVLAHADDADGLPVPVDERLTDGDEVTFGNVRLRVIHLVGHTPGSIALSYEPDGGHLFTGDSLFPGGPGNTWNDPARFTSLMDDLEAKVFGRLPDSTWVYPGHGNDTTLGAERPHLAEWRARGW